MTYHAMKIAVIGSGNVGKTTIAAHLLGAFRPQAELVTVDSFNNRDALNIDSLNVEELQVRRFRAIYMKMMESDDLIVDVGASNIETFLAELGKNRTAIDEFDMIVIPTVPDDKQQKDTIMIIGLLHKLGFAGEKIRVVFNQNPGDETIHHVYPIIIGYSVSDGKDKVNWTHPAIVNVNELFGLIKDTGKTVSELAADNTDWRAIRKQARLTKDTNAEIRAMDDQINHGLACSVQENLQQAYADLFAPYENAK